MTEDKSEQSQAQRRDKILNNLKYCGNTSNFRLTNGANAHVTC
ncbi:hypothetical protein T12_1169 [Trichinella patagoniensis]|uniref:Uncharacterized protein n=1 Tax=Trichinella patagoniensis TaxID=990121 RepID=A0A0V0YSI5_9BILA|nr:hypothetical protein T12_1169 [Trichinella patagoniensis]